MEIGPTGINWMIILFILFWSRRERERGMMGDGDGHGGQKREGATGHSSDTQAPPPTAESLPGQSG